MRFLLILISFLFFSCSKEGKSLNGLTKVTLQLNWFPEAEHGGYYEALEKGYYKELGLDVEIISGSPGIRVETETALGRVDFICNCTLQAKKSNLQTNFLAHRNRSTGDL